MENTPITLEEANEHLSKALKVGDTQEIEKWDYIIRSINDYRVKGKQRMREIQNFNLRASLKRSYSLTD